MDTKNFTHAMRLFKGVPVWTPINRPADTHLSRERYLLESQWKRNAPRGVLFRASSIYILWFQHLLTPFNGQQNGFPQVQVQELTKHLLLQQKPQTYPAGLELTLLQRYSLD
ncbi:unnamed protein product [Durusdinium trenchii]|uniref:Uncharacterized protein n=1 Tax=Durusdinium trenchii TaxID=1381693 RepID=A0ABP0SVC3_9DINO